jgi:hypothetical protein
VGLGAWAKTADAVRSTAAAADARTQGIRFMRNPPLETKKEAKTATILY